MNKIKGSSSAVRMKHLLTIFAVAIIVVLPLRVYQLIVSVDSATGFFAEGDITAPILYGVIAVAVLSLLILSFICKGMPKPELYNGKNPIMALASFAAAAGMALDAIYIKNILVPMVGDTQQILSNNLNANGGTFLGLRFVFAIISIVWFLLTGLSHLSGRGAYKKMPLLALAPVGWSLLSLVSRIIEPINFLKESEVLFEVAFFVFASLFFFTFARISTGTFTVNSMWGIFGYGFCALLFAGAITIPRITVHYLGLELVKGCEISVAQTTAMLFIAAAVAACNGIGFIGKKKELQRIEEVELPDDDEVVVKGTSSVSVVEDFTDDLPQKGVMVQEVSETEITAAIEGLLGKRLTIDIDENDVIDIFDEDEDAEITEEIDEPIEEVSEEIVVDEPIEEVSEEIVIDEPIEEVSEEIVIDEPIEEVSEEVIIDEPVEEVSEEIVIDEPIEEVSEEVIIDEPVEEVSEEIVIDEPVEEVSEEIVIDEPVEEVSEEIVIDEPIEEVSEEIIIDAPVEEDATKDEGFVDFSEMLINEDEEFENDVESVDAVVSHSSSTIIDVDDSAEKQSYKKTKKEKIKLFGKKSEAAEEMDVTLKPISLAELRSKKESEQ